MRGCHLAFVAAIAVLALGACSTGEGSEQTGEPVQSGSSQSEAAPLQQSDDERVEEEQTVVGTTVHFTAGQTVVEVAITEDNATTRDFLSMLPMTLVFEDFNGMEKIAYPPRGLDVTGSEGMKPEVGDLFSYVPWENLGFFYDTGSLGFSQQLVRIGRTDDIEGVKALGGQEVTIDVAR